MICWGGLSMLFWKAAPAASFKTTISSISDPWGIRKFPDADLISSRATLVASLWMAALAASIFLAALAASFLSSKWTFLTNWRTKISYHFFRRVWYHVLQGYGMDVKWKQFLTIYFLNKSEKQGEGVAHFTTIMNGHQDTFSRIQYYFWKKVATRGCGPQILLMLFSPRTKKGTTATWLQPASRG